MKSIIFILILNSLIFYACREERCMSDNEVSNIKDNILASHIDNKDSVFNVVENNILQYACFNNIPIPNDKVRRYNTIDSLLHILYCSKRPQITSIDIKDDLAITENQLRFLNHYLQRELRNAVNNRISQLLDYEQLLSDRLISAQESFLKTHIDDAGLDGSCWFMKYYNADIAILGDLNKSLKDLLSSTTSSKSNVQTTNSLLAQSFFNEGFQNVFDDLIPQKPLFDDEPLSNYNEDADRESVKSMREALSRLLANRNEIASLLPDNQRLVWDNATHRFQRTQLIILKNEFVNLGIYGNEIENCLLSDSCTDEQLMAYPNFSTKWEEHLKELEK